MTVSALPLHWYLFVFQKTLPAELGGSTTSTDTLIRGLPEQRVTFADIKQAKDACGAHPDAIALSINYLGRMSTADMMKDHP